jgi:hypothetical protein
MALLYEAYIFIVTGSEMPVKGKGGSNQRDATALPGSARAED